MPSVVELDRVIERRVGIDLRVVWEVPERRPCRLVLGVLDATDLASELVEPGPKFVRLLVPGSHYEGDQENGEYEEEREQEKPGIVHQCGFRCFQVMLALPVDHAAAS